ncbi:hypothetical protein JSO61_001170 [Riemerella anatipestifer]|uniref:hypothetical protein n=1 Tax=Riemerella anatipestifer TaxID=34085 RepID=UPI001374DA1D|nr:hypothetical protein [Riemerella anatipestifer]MDY3362957.1 hypothetical protein [Riemerella anatipestifer]MDY3520524.1 hypothetical protein [Riemerella anatipestifer]MDY3532423.1 hypothetical protein [Riemerella anatipestifer]MDY3535022.1 hypothetical protein [Riemerella anatipestifer]
MAKKSIIKMNNFRNKTFLKFLWGILGVYFMNISIDTPDDDRYYFSETSNYNDMESIIEVIVEKVFKYENAIEESEEYDLDNYTKKAKYNWFFGLFSLCKSVQMVEICFSKYIRAVGVSKLLNGFSQFDVPPPKI